ncbi:MAG TPA: hypothetical protein PLP25_00230 [Candidatus Limiplasma sp.]|nr:hypothetical protein [Candidatus Limiplasma sp.]HPS80268.1 hypothetical protein [Candidatus Limiplasma sp.]
MFRFSPIQYRAEGDAPAGSLSPAPAAVATPSAAQIAEETMKLIDAASEKKAHGITKSMAEQNGLTEEELVAYIAEKKAAKANALPESAQKQIDAAKAELQKYKLAAEVTKEGAALGLLDADVAMTLLGEDATKANDKGEFAGLKPALEKLKETKPYLFGATQKPGAMAQRVSGAAPQTLSGVEKRFYDKNPGLKKPE